MQCIGFPLKILLKMICFQWESDALHRIPVQNTILNGENLNLFIFNIFLEKKYKQIRKFVNKEEKVAIEIRCSASDFH